MSDGTKANTIATFTSAELEATADAALGVLEQVGARAEALVDEWVKHGNAAAVVTVAESENGAYYGRSATPREIIEGSVTNPRSLELGHATRKLFE